MLGYDGGHAILGVVGARGNGLLEEVKAREVVSELLRIGKVNGIEGINISCDNSTNVNHQLQTICNNANKQPLELSIHIHLNAFHEISANGVEVYYHSGSYKGKSYATKIQNKLVKDIGWYNRGVKTANFKVLTGTKGTAVLVECGFITNSDDMKKFNPTRIAKSILEAVTGKVIKDEIINPNPPSGDCDEIHRVVVDGKQIGAFGNHDNVLKVVEENLGKKIEIK